MTKRLLLCLLLVLVGGCSTAPPPKPRSSPIIFQAGPVIGGHCIQITQDGKTYTYYSPRWIKCKPFLVRVTPVCAATQPEQEEQDAESPCDIP